MSKTAETKATKRKGASEPSVAAKKTKIGASKDATTAPKSAMKKTVSRTIVKSAVPETITVNETKKPRKKAEDLNAQEGKTADENTTNVAPVKVKKTKTVVTTQPEDGKSVSTKTTVIKEKAVAAKPAKASKKDAAPAADDFDGFSGDEDDDINEDDEKIDDQTAALLAGFESSEDENDPQDEGIALDKVPALPNSKEMKKALLAAQITDDENTPGVIYVGRIPHGFFEHQMRAYFSQFGEITHLRLSRNKLTGRSKHYAFLEFASGAVAEIVAKTMDKYLMFGHILQVRRIPKDQVHANLWKGEGKRFKVMPRNKLEGGMLKRGATREQWARRVQKENTRRTRSSDKLKAFDYEFEAPTLKKVTDVPVKETPVETLTITAEDEEDGAKAGTETVEAPAEEAAVVAGDVPGATAATESPANKRKAKGKASKVVKKSRVST